MRHRSSLDS